MSDDEIILSLSVPADPDGFLRRECPTCDREFKWRISDGDDELAGVADEGYFCPYCKVQAPVDSWFTQAQIEAAKAKALEEILGPSIEGLKRSAKNASSGFVSVSVETDLTEAPAANADDQEMRQVDFQCHDEPVKVLEDWSDPVYCMVCGTSAA